MAAATLALSAAKGEAVTFNGTHQTSATDATAINITGWTIVVTARDTAGNVVLNKTASITSGASGTYAFSVTKADTLIQPRPYALDIQRTDSGSEKLMGYGTFTVTPQVLNP